MLLHAPDPNDTKSLAAPLPLPTATGSVAAAANDGQGEKDPKDIANEKFWETFDDIHRFFQLLRALTVLCKISHTYTESQTYAHPIADFFESRFGNLERGWDENGNAASAAFTALSLVYLLYLVIILGKVIKNKTDQDNKDAFKHLPYCVRFAIVEAVIWGLANIGMALFSYIAKNSNIADLGVFGLFTLAITGDVINAAIEMTRGINQLEADKKAIAQSNDTEEEKIRKTAALETRLFILHGKRFSYIGFGFFAVAGGLSVVTSSALALTGNASFEVVSAHLAIAGSYALTGASLLFAVFRLVCEVTAYAKEHRDLTVQLNSASVTNRELLLNRQTELKYEMAKSVIYYGGLILVLGVSVLAGPVGGLIAFAAFFAVNLICKHFIEPKIKAKLNIGDAPAPAGKKPIPALQTA